MVGSRVTLKGLIAEARRLGFNAWQVYLIDVPGYTKDERWADLYEMQECEDMSRRYKGNHRWVVVDGGIDVERRILWTVDEIGRRSEGPIRESVGA